MKFTLLALAFLLVNQAATCQESVEDSFEKISAIYFDSLGLDKTPIYIGEVDPLTVRSRTSNPYHKSRSWLEGSIYFDQSLYQNVSFLYDLLDQRLILKQADPTKRGGLVIDLSKVQWFVIADDYFRKSPFDTQDRFLHSLHEGKNFNLVAFRRKGTDTSTSGIDFTDKTEYFVEYQNVLVPIRSKGDLKSVFSTYKITNQAVKAENSKLKYSKFKEDLFINYMKVFDEKLQE